ncbi:hypothetical protein CSV67_05945 [Sporosarcina sp. P2]|uniref:hypothetical protein n=1 Tax=unclassified Sporosarcina TaxID=2647733 RepID=UPI000C16637C|nr:MULTISPECIES: hypothetical protein [unclassified Sporosarcina]PIC69063.1 hypothetical protein CSV77_15675 [Sporosarcina sp. P16b]PID03007.1 hypothetical protein CSV67_05945 [Sporosarcina sp. P2]
MIKKRKNNMRFLFITFFVTPFILSIVIGFNFLDLNFLLENENIKSSLDISGYLFTLSSLSLVFILFKNFKRSDYTRFEINKNYLENNAEEKLVHSLTNIKVCLTENTVKDLYSSCIVIKNIYNDLKDEQSDVDLKAYTSEIKSVFNLLNKFKLSSIGFESDIVKFKSITSDNKHYIVGKIDELLWQLKQRSSLNE